MTPGKSLRINIIAGLVSFLLAFIIVFPARVAVSWFAPDTVGISDISGTVWSGSAGALVAGDIALTGVEWRLKPLSLLTLKPGVSLRANLPRGRIETELRIIGGNSAELNDLVASIPLDLLAAAVRNTGLSGDARLDFSRVVFVDGAPSEAVGVATLNNLTVPQAYSGNLGGYQLEFTSADGSIVASIEDTDGALDLAGSLTLRADQSYSLLAVISPKPTTDDELLQRIQMLPRGDADNQYQVRLEGSL